MSIVFENIDNGQTLSINRESEGKYYLSKLTAAINSSNLSPNADRGQDYGWRLQPEQQAIIEEWESDPQMIDKVSNHTKVPTDGLTHSEFLAYMLYEQELGKSPEKAIEQQRREKQGDYDARVAAIKAMLRPEAVPAFSDKKK